MVKPKRKIIHIDEEKCNGCGLCIPSCPEGALQIIDGKAKLVKESFCDGLGACLGECPQGALTITEAEVDEYDEEGVIAQLKEKSPELLEKHLAHLEAHRAELSPSQKHSHELHQHSFHPPISACPSARVLHWEEKETPVEERVKIASELRQWPVQLHLVPPWAPYFQDAHLLIVADCVPFTYANFHTDFLKDKAIAIGCPKLDDTEPYLNKIAQILQNSDIKSFQVVVMEVPCCSGLVRICQESLRKSGKNIPLEVVVISIRGEVLKKEMFEGELPVSR